MVYLLCRLSNESARTRGYAGAANATNVMLRAERLVRAVRPRGRAVFVYQASMDFMLIKFKKSVLESPNHTDLYLKFYKYKTVSPYKMKPIMKIIIKTLRQPGLFMFEFYIWGKFKKFLY